MLLVLPNVAQKWSELMAHWAHQVLSVKVKLSHLKLTRLDILQPLSGILGITTIKVVLKNLRLTTLLLEPTPLLSKETDLQVSVQKR